jgi:uroporphyrinogen decarboxylase
VLAGNVDPSAVMALGTSEDVLEHCREAIHTMGQRGWFMLSPGCTLPANTPAENTAAMVEAARRFGRYGPEGLLGE